MPQSLQKQLEKSGQLEEVVRHAELHGYISTSVKYDRDPGAIKKMLEKVTGDDNFGREPILKTGDTPRDIITLLVETFEDRLLKRIKRIEILETQLGDALTKVDYYKTMGEARITGKLKEFFTKE